MKRYARHLLPICAALFLSGCCIIYGCHEVRELPDTATLQQRGFYARSFAGVTAYEKVRSAGQVAAVYIGGSELAVKDVSPNVIYLSGDDGDIPAALDALKAQHQFFGFNLVVALRDASHIVRMLLPRTDILSLRNVAGRLDPDLAKDLPRLPQKHFVAAADNLVQDYLDAAARPDCLTATPVDGVKTLDDWAARWPDLLEQPLEGGCQ